MSVPAEPGTDIVRVDLRRVQMRLRRPHRAAHGGEELRPSILVQVTSADGYVGWGECPALSRPSYTPEHHDGAWDRLRLDAAPGLIGAGAIDAGWDARSPEPMATGSVADALLDCQLRAQGRGFLRTFVGRGRPVPTTTVVSLTASVEDLLAEAEQVAGGIKVKVEPGNDVAPLRALRTAFPDRWLAADANGSYSVDDQEHRAHLAALDELGLAYLEQPCPGIEANADLSRRMRTVICLDEPIDSLAAAEEARRLGALGALNVKPARVGGLGPACWLLRWCATQRIPAFVGGMLETGVGRAGAVCLTFAPGSTLPTDLGPSSRYWDQDVTAPIVLDDAGHLVPPDGLGIGVVPDPDRLAAVTVEHLTFIR